MLNEKSESYNGLYQDMTTTSTDVNKSDKK